MSFNPSPTGYFPDIVTLASGDSVSDSGVFIPYSNLESYDPSTSGDIRQLIYSFNEAVTDTFVSLSSANRPTQLSILRSASVPEDNIIRKVYTITVNLAFSGLSVVPE